VLFNSYVFILGFLPLTLFLFFLIAKKSHAGAAVFLVIASVFFYGWWDPRYVLLLLGSIAFNYTAGRILSSRSGSTSDRKRLLWIAVTANLALLGYYKYANFFVSNVNEVTTAGFALPEIVLPLGISFFTFTQIAFLVDAFRHEAKEYNFIHYALFVTYFPHLIAGPILHHKEMMPQFGRPSTYRFSWENLAVGLTFFFIGLFKKAFLADSIAPYANAVFTAGDAGKNLSFVEAWEGALAYSLQLYFDFSGYSDMAIGLSRMFGIKFPLNFASPYKSVNIVEFWRRWHMTLSRFLRDYLYIPLGGSKKGPLRRYENLMATMLLGGLWHGAGWTFVAWGGLHGIYLVANHAWDAIRRSLGWRSIALSPWYIGISVFITFVAVVIGWVFFRSSTFQGALAILASMSGRHGFALPASWEDGMAPQLISLLRSLGREFRATAVETDVWGPVWIGALLCIVWAMPNTQQVLRLFDPALEPAGGDRMAGNSRLVWRPNLAWSIAIAGLAVLAFTSGNEISEFLYFQF
jgi:alginate O-acetyltransferase complex protein AlgI